MGIDARMIVALRKGHTMTDAEVRELSSRLVECVGKDPFWMYWEGECDWRDKGDSQHALTNRTEDEYNMPDDDVSGRQLIMVNLSGRYYGEGYERGHLPYYIMIAEFLERNLLGCSVYYGGDSGVGLPLFDFAARNALMNYWAWP
jgi:hypothetical protein